MRRGFRAGLVAAGITLSSGFARAECTKDLDCEGEQICEAGKCSAPPPPAPAPPAPAPAPASPPAPAPAAPPAAAPAAAPVRFFDEDEASKPRVKKRLKSPGLLAVGITSTAAGVIVLAYGYATNGCVNDSSTRYCDDDDDEKQTFTLVSLGLIAVGVPMIVIGSRREPVPRVAIAPVVSPRYGGLQFQLRL
jgi:uncharacterized membrane protein